VRPREAAKSEHHVSHFTDAGAGGLAVNGRATPPNVSDTMRYLDRWRSMSQNRDSASLLPIHWVGKSTDMRFNVDAATC
jgi:hypothetical protein